MDSYIYIDYENMSNLRILSPKNGVKYFVFLGAKQKDGLKTMPGAKVKRIHGKFISKDFLDHKIEEFIMNRKQVQGVFHYIFSKDRGFDSFVKYMKKEHGMKIERIEDFEGIDKIHLN